MKRLPPAVRKFADHFRNAGYELYVVGGAVRDALLRRPVTDYDFATSATPREVQDLFRRTIPTGIRHGTVTVLFEGGQYEVTTYRVDGTYEDHRRPDEVTFTRSLDEDLARRDLTINAIAQDPLTGELRDPFDGQGDIRRRIIRTVGKADDRFGEDALRMVRAVRFAATLEFAIDPETREAITAHAATIRRVAAERVFQELSRMMGSRRPSVGWRDLRETGLLAYLVPELLEDAGTREDGIILPPVFDHLLRTCDCSPADEPVLRWAALLHDVAKPRCAAIDDRGLHFHGHDELSAEMCAEILRRLRSSRELAEGASHLIRHHMFGIGPESSDAAIRRFVARVGRGAVTPLLALRRADICGKSGDAPSGPDLARLEDRVARVIEEEAALTVRDLAINGGDLMTALHLPPGPLVGVILDELLETVLDDPSRNERDTLLEIGRRFYDERVRDPSG
jgi:tRNA nucleotidyltransferase (CCA-adding enzyme)